MVLHSIIKCHRTELILKAKHLQNHVLKSRYVLKHYLYSSNFSSHLYTILSSLENKYSSYQTLTLYKCLCSFVIPFNFRALLLWMLLSLFKRKITGGVL